MRRRRITQILTWLIVVGLPVLAWVKATSAGRRAERAERAAAAVAEVGSPVVAQHAALRAVGTWAGEPGAVVETSTQGRDRWQVVVTLGATCYGVLVEQGAVSAHPGMVPCPPTPAAGASGGRLADQDSRAVTATGFLVAWLTGDAAASRWLADDTPALSSPGVRASLVDTSSVTGIDLVDESPGDTSEVTVTADVTVPGALERQAWTVGLVRGESRWDVTSLSGGEAPSGDRFSGSRPNPGHDPDHHDHHGELMMTMFGLLAQARFEKVTDTANQATQLLQVVVFPLICVAVLLGVLMRTRSLAAVVGAVFPLALAAVFVYNPATFQTVGSWFI